MIYRVLLGSIGVRGLKNPKRNHRAIGVYRVWRFGFGVQGLRSI